MPLHSVPVSHVLPDLTTQKLAKVVVGALVPLLVPAIFFKLLVFPQVWVAVVPDMQLQHVKTLTTVLHGGSINALAMERTLDVLKMLDAMK